MNLTENILLVWALLLFVAVAAGKLAYKFGAPALLLFLSVGMFFGWHFISFNSFELTQFLGMLALCIILFSGGMDTKFSEIRPVLAPGITLATLGVAMTACLVGGFIYFFSSWVGLALSFPVALLLAATMSSTDSASVFSILRSKKQGLSQNLRPLLELESGSNDPMAYMLTIVLVAAVSASGEQTSVWISIVRFIVQMLVGCGLGYGIGRMAVFAINRINIKNNASLYSVLLLAFVFFSFSFTNLLWGNGYLAVYITGLVVGNNKIAHKSNLSTFFDGFTWLAQIVLFLTIGLLVNLDELLQPEILLLSCAVGIFLIVIARPLTVFTCLAPFRKFTTKARMYISWVGLRGAVPIIFATYPIVEGIDDGSLIFNVVFMGTLFSLLIQGTTVSAMAHWLGLAYEEKEPLFKVGIPDSIKSNFSEIGVTEAMLAKGRTLRDIDIADNTLVVMISRNAEYFVPRGNTELQVGDHLLVVSDRSDEELQQMYADLGIEDVMNLR
ncbi:MAG: potassium/proton antiporter [Alistipes sp.]|nr:potassium/proton antiporter [Alistipes sp.]